jgi:hypothetical protein
MACSTTEPQATGGDVTTTTGVGQSETGTSNIVLTGGGSSGATGEASTSDATTSGPPATGSETGSFVAGPDVPREPCDPYAQDCPEGMKCTWTSEDPSALWQTAECVPLARTPVKIDEPCVAEDILHGLDDCELGAICWNLDDTDHGTCVGFCEGSPERPACPSGHYCAAGRTLALCIDQCDPLAQDCQQAEEKCLPVDGSYVCIIEGSDDGGELHTPCAFANSCDPGLLCLPQTAAVECDQAESGCCEPMCDLGDPDPCPGVGQVCLPVYDPQPAMYEHVGFCSVKP